ncbi:MAG TPA: hypothetical protein V6D17_03070 [Candidatus Obscuribacterales bacterium]
MTSAFVWREYYDGIDCQVMRASMHYRARLALIACFLFSSAEFVSMFSGMSVIVSLVDVDNVDDMSLEDTLRADIMMLNAPLPLMVVALSLLPHQLE